MFKLFRFLLYCFAVFIGVAGLLEGGWPLLQYTIERLEGKYFDAYVLLSTYDRFSSEVILILSLMLLIMVHIGHVLAGGFCFTKSEKPALPHTLPADSPRPSPEAADGPLPVSEPESKRTDLDKADEKLASLVKKANE